MKFFFSNLVFAAIVVARSNAADKATKNEEAALRAQHRHGGGDGEMRNLALRHRPRQWEPRIVGGSPTTDGDYPFFVQGDGCGASLIWKDIVLTAAHCKGYIADLQNRVLVGAQTWRTETANSEWVNVASEITHPDYDGDVFKDYMIVKLANEVTNPNVEMVGLAGDSTPLGAGDPLTVIGFGATSEGGSSSNTLLEVSVDYVSTATCNSVYGSDSAYDPNFMFCASAPGKDSCQGDSGGPLFINNDKIQVGVVSWGYGCAQPGVPGVYSTVSAEIEWIKQMVCQNAQNPPTWACAGGTSPVPAPGNPPPSTTNPPPATTNPPPVTTNPPPTTSNPPPPSGSFNIQVTITHDDWPEETSWSLSDASGNVLLFQEANTVLEYGAVVTESVSVEDGEYSFIIDDTQGDGVCCSYGSGSYDVSVNGNNVYSGADFGASSGDLVFCLSGGTVATGVCSAPTLAPPGRDDVEYILTVAYDFFPEETGVTVTRVSSGTVLVDLPENSEFEPEAFRVRYLNLVPGEEYELFVADSYGDGMPDDNCYDDSAFSYVAIDIYKNGEFENELAFIDGCDFFDDASAMFTIPETKYLRKMKNPPAHAKRNKASLCKNTRDSFVVKGIEQDCQWLERNWPKTEVFCGEKQVAKACPSTCGACDLV